MRECVAVLVAAFAAGALSAGPTTAISAGQTPVELWPATGIGATRAAADAPMTADAASATTTMRGLALPPAFWLALDLDALLIDRAQPGLLRAEPSLRSVEAGLGGLAAVMR
jgi:hypothetical protein